MQKKIGLGTDHRLFEKQIEYFIDKVSILVWDAPGHGQSRPFDLSFSLADEARWLHDMIVHESVNYPVLNGHSTTVSGCFGCALGNFWSKPHHSAALKQNTDASL